MKNNIHVYVGLISSISIFYFRYYFYILIRIAINYLIKTFHHGSFHVITPSFWAFISIVKENILILICSIWLLPGGIYFGISTIPSVWNLYILFLLFIFVCFQMKTKQS